MSDFNDLSAQQTTCSRTGLVILILQYFILLFVKNVLCPKMTAFYCLILQYLNCNASVVCAKSNKELLLPTLNILG